MQTVLALDIGTKRTGVAFCSTDTNVPIALTTINQQQLKPWLQAVIDVIESKNATMLVVGLPLLPNASVGKQAEFVQERITALQTLVPHCTIVTIDERYTSFSHKEIDTDAAAAVQILQVWLDNQQYV